MRRLIVLVTVALVVAVGAPAVGVPARTYKTCAQVNAVYPTGVARTAGAAAGVAAVGFERPVVNKRLYTVMVKAAPRLDRPLNGVVCEVPRTVKAPSAVQGLVVTSTGQTAVTLVWTPPADQGNGTVSGYEVTGGGVAAVTGTLASISGLTPGTSYTFTVVAVNEAGPGAPASVSATTATVPAPTPTPTPTPTPAAVRYENCAAARAAGVTPIRAPSALYDANRHLDRDGDGVACE